MAFNFGQFANVQTPSNISYLKPYTINKNVTIKGTEIKEGTSANGNPWKSLTITFGNEEGIYKESIFYFDEKDPKLLERATFDMPNGGKREAPSKFETFMNTVAAISMTFNPEGFAKFQKLASKISTCEDFMKAFKQVCDSAVDKNPTCMKLVGRNSNGHVYAALPKCTGIAQATTEKKAVDNNVELNDWYTWTVLPFGDESKLSFTPYEEKQMQALKDAKPTPMVDNEIDSSHGSEDDIDFSTLL